MLRITADTHTHTVHSHGTGTVEDNVRAAIDRGLSCIAVSDHGMQHLCYNIKNMDDYLRDIDAVRKKYAGYIDVLTGIEMNLLSSDGDIDFPVKWAQYFDLRLMGYHKLVRYKTLSDKLHMLLFKTKGENAVTRNTAAYIHAMDRFKIDIITHPNYGLPVDLIALAKHAAKKGVALEINAKHPEFTTNELVACAKTGVKFSVGSDAHSPVRVGDFLPALKKAHAAGISAEQILYAENDACPQDK
ncbi:MAG: PHP domain-containing protein [Christensenella sp.]